MSCRADAVGFRDPDFVLLCDTVRGLWEVRRSPVRLVARCAAAARSAPTGVAALRRLPRLTLTLPDSPAGTDIRRKVLASRGGLPNRVALAHLAIPAEGSSYLRGRSRQALRTNCTRGRAAGLSCREVTGDDARRRTVALLEQRGAHLLVDPLLEHLDSGRSDFWLAETADGETVALAVTTTDRAVTRLDCLMALEVGASDARYLLTTHVVLALAARGVRHLVVDSVLLLDGGLRQFQQRLGFEPVTVRFAAPGRR